MLGLLLSVALTSGPLSPQEPLVRAKAYYAAAAYEDALRALSTTAPSTSAPDAAEIAAYRVFCLLALGRADEARSEIESLVRVDPLYRPTAEQASPRVLTFFDEVRRPMLPDAARRSYVTARDAFDRQELLAAENGFARVVALIDDIGEFDDGNLAELRTLAAEFRSLSEAMLTKPEAAAPAAAGTEAAGMAPAAGAGASAAEPATEPKPDPIYTDEDADVVKPEAVSRELPPWQRPAGISSARVPTGVLELVIDHDGHVESATMRESIDPGYDPVLLQAAKHWRFKPATKDGVPVCYRYRIAVRLGR